MNYIIIGLLVLMTIQVLYAFALGKARARKPFPHSSGSIGEKTQIVGGGPKSTHGLVNHGLWRLL